MNTWKRTHRVVKNVAPIIVACLAVAIVALYFHLVGPIPLGVVASLRLADGSEYVVTQRDNGNWAEPYTVEFFMRSPGKPWGWCYIDHQANGWRRVSMTYDAATDVVTVAKRGIWQAALDRKRSAFSIGDGKPKRELDAPQEDRRPDLVFR